MLVLSRKKNESIMIGGHIEVTVLGVEGDTVKLGISAPKEIEIFRKEIYAAIQAANREAAQGGAAMDMLAKLLEGRRGGE